MLARKAKSLATGIGRLERKVGESCVQGKKAGGRNSEACAQGKNACDRVSEAARKGREVGKPTDPRSQPSQLKAWQFWAHPRGLFIASVYFPTVIPAYAGIQPAAHAHYGHARCFGRTRTPHTFSPAHGSRPAPG